MSTWKVILATLVIFGAGVVTGGLFNRQCTKLICNAGKPAAPVVESTTNTNRGVPPPAQIPGMRKDFVKRMDRELNLSPEQREKIDKIMADGQLHIKELWERIAPECHETWNTTQEKIRAELTEEQKVQFVEFMKNPRKKYPPKKEPPAPAECATNAPAASTTNAPAAQ